MSQAALRTGIPGRFSCGTSARSKEARGGGPRGPGRDTATEQAVRMPREAVDMAEPSREATGVRSTDAKRVRAGEGSDPSGLRLALPSTRSLHGLGLVTRKPVVTLSRFRGH